MACFFFHPRKAITTGDGGMLTTSRREWDSQFRLWRQHGMSVPDKARHEASRVVFQREVMQRMLDAGVDTLTGVPALAGQPMVDVPVLCYRIPDKIDPTLAEVSSFYATLAART